MRMLLPVVAMISFAGLCHGAVAQAQCPELTRLRNEAVEAAKPRARSLMPGCDGYIRASRAWSAVVDYASEHQDVCGISDRLLGDFATYRREAVTARNNVCSGRPARPFPADIVLQ
ncbi:hypothetical protein JQ612_00235 [Bradyrhizobium manausense]|uniref:hypothetical protein n=1 Tax=Bradyrhizobium manausense TaxID=989370 RepID=UPI001BABB405|nr:hypothetical protein [Bradyrhizobium manausense]MBR0687250.1 hypothetical protein [Bradyrhizobium manausense]MBR0725799.1 hypothetical protein [Bradyrhizobium manausense]MBR0831603.1 hypothetical protein [Bradyrhizobium manausense]